MIDRDWIGEAFAVLLAFWVVAGFVRAQTQPPRPLPAPSQQSLERPGDVYKELMHPLDEVRSTLGNWSPAELAALAAGIKRAQEYCGQVAPASVSGDDLYQLARVCSVGQRWNDADAAASTYIKSGRQPTRRTHTRSE